MDRRALLKAAIEDNIAWCAAVSASHGSQEFQTEEAWANLATAPRYYPNVITRQPGAQAAVMALVARLQGPKPWSIKDSFHDLDFHDLGFAPIIEAQWLGGFPASTGAADDRWERVRSPEELAVWSQAWGGTSPFKPVLLRDPRINFWQLRRYGSVAGGGISFTSGSAIGLSNWFATGAETVFSLDLTAAIAAAFPRLPLVLWTEEGTAEIESHGLRPLGRLRVWTAG